MCWFASCIDADIQPEVLDTMAIVFCHGHVQSPVTWWAYQVPAQEREEWSNETKGHIAPLSSPISILWQVHEVSPCNANLPLKGHSIPSYWGTLGPHILKMPVTQGRTSFLYTLKQPFSRSFRLFSSLSTVLFCLHPSADF